MQKTPTLRKHSRNVKPIKLRNNSRKTEDKKLPRKKCSIKTLHQTDNHTHASQKTQKLWRFFVDDCYFCLKWNGISTIEVWNPIVLDVAIAKEMGMKMQMVSWFDKSWNLNHDNTITKVNENNTNVLWFTFFLLTFVTFRLLTLLVNTLSNVCEVFEMLFFLY